MKIKPILLRLLLVLNACSISGFSQTNWFSDFKKLSWLAPVSSLELLKTTKADIEQNIGKPEKFGFDGADFIEYYTTREGRITAIFTTAECRSATGQQIPKGTLEEFNFQLSKLRSFSSLNLPLSEFNHSRESDTPNEFYTNKDYGVNITVFNNRVTDIRFSVPVNLQPSCANP